MTTLTAPAPLHAGTATANPLLQLHRQLFPERYADVALSLWTTQSVTDLSHLLAALRTAGHDRATAAALANIAHALDDVDDLGQAEALDAAATVLEAACRRLLVADVVAL